jgi:hypothetical protein
VLAHIQKLRKTGIGYKAIAAAADLAKSTLAMILTGERLQIRKHHANRILAVDRSAVADGALVPGRRTWALLNELLAPGYTRTFLAKQLGSRAKTPSLQIQAQNHGNGRKHGISDPARNCSQSRRPRCRAKPGTGSIGLKAAGLECR